jgi:hypothetical protein
MTPLLLVFLALSLFTTVSYSYYILAEQPKDNLLYTWGSKLDEIWFNEGNKI